MPTLMTLLGRGISCIRRTMQTLASGLTEYDVKMGKICTPSTAPLAVEQAKEHLSSNHVIALPTDTVYGLACNANSEEAIQKLYEIKGRNEEKPVAICVADLEDFYYWGDGGHLPRELLSQLLPGPVTIVVNRSVHLNNPFLNCGIRKIGIRIPDFNFIRDLSRCFRQPIALTSANRSSEKSTLHVNEFRELWPELGIVIDGGQLGLLESQRSASTVVDLAEPGYYSIIREGVAVKQTEAVVQSFNIKTK